MNKKVLVDNMNFTIRKPTPLGKLPEQNMKPQFCF